MDDSWELALPEPAYTIGCVDMKNIEEGTLKDLGIGQKNLFDYAECQELRKLIREAKRKAGIAEGRRIYPHLFRFTAATRDSIKYTEPILRKKFRWKPDSQMPSYYQNISNEDYKNVVVDNNGDGQLLSCEVCGHKNPVTLEFCQNCHRPLMINGS